MKFATTLFCLLIISTCFCNYSNTYIKKDSVAINQPEFLDNGKTIDSLKKVFACESINYENWDNKSVTDSCLTICLINSTKVPLVNNVQNSFENRVTQLKGIALSIKKVLVKPNTYKSFYVIFVKKYNDKGMEIKVHSAGMEILSSEL